MTTSTTDSANTPPRQSFRQSFPTDFFDAPRRAQALALYAPYARAMGIGVVTGLRSMTPLALLALALNRPDSAVPAWNARLARYTHSRLALAISAITLTAAIGEAIFDKTPIIPARIQPGPLLGRLAIGAATGGVLCRSEDASPWVGAALGAATAGVTAAGAFYTRREVKRLTHVPDFALGLGEDLLAGSLGAVVARLVKTSA